MAEKTEGTNVEFVTAEAKALDLAAELVSKVMGEYWSSGELSGRRWEGVDMNNPDAVKTRLQEVADLIGDLKQRMLK